MKKLTAMVIGYGMRGSRYSDYAVQYPDQMEIVAVADPAPVKQEFAKKAHNLTDEQIYSDWRDLAALPKMADFAIITTQDNMHYEPALAMIEKGYDLLLEKPMAPTPKECKDITEAAEKKGVKVVVCHVLRFTKFWYKIKDIIDNGEIGRIISIIHMENVGNEHQSHSYVRGNWRRLEESSPMILAKSCHDIDILQWLIGKECKQVQSFGSLTYFTEENKPEGAPARCTDGCPHGDTCYYNAMKLYYDAKWNDWFRSVCAGKFGPNDEEVLEALKTGPYGRCVYSCDNDVVDHQVVNMEFEDGCTVSFTMNAFNEGGRFIRIFGTKGEIVASMEHSTIDVFSFATRKHTVYNYEQINTGIVGGHGGGDFGVVVDALKYFSNETPSKSICTVRTSCLNHIATFAAEESRVKNVIVDVKKYAEEIW